MMEVEYKAAVSDLEAVHARLLALGATPGETQEETDTYYGHPQRAFGTTDEALRIRSTAAGRRLTYKGPRVATGPTRSRREIEVDLVGDLGAILEALSFTVAGRVVKERRAYRLGEITVTLDRVRGLGDYAEVEALAADDAVGAARDAVLGVVRQLGLGPEERRSYLELVLGQGTGSSGDAASAPP